MFCWRRGGVRAEYWGGIVRSSVFGLAHAGGEARPAEIFGGPPLLRAQCRQFLECVQRQTKQRWILGRLPDR